MLTMTSIGEMRRGKPFRFMAMWMRHKGLKDFIQKT